MEDLKDILYDDVEQKFIELQDKKKKRKIRWRRVKNIVILTVLVIGTVYFASDYSKVKSLSVSGNIIQIRISCIWQIYPMKHAM